MSKTGRNIVVLSVELLVCQIALTAVLVSAAEVKSPWQVEWEKTLEAATKEGHVYINSTNTWGPALDAGVFQRRYPQIKLIRVTARGGEGVQRLIAERRAGKFLVDVFMHGITESYAVLYRAKMLDPIKPLLVLPEVVDESKWWQGRHRYIDPEGKYIFAFAGVPQPGSIYYNTKLVDFREFKSLWDFLNPKWKGKMEARDPRAPGAGGGSMRFFYHHPDLGPPFIRRLFSEMEIQLVRDFRQASDWLAIGKFAICFFCSDMSRAKKLGLPVESIGILKEGAGLVARGGTMALLNNAPNPNAAKVFINWFLSREGQLTIQKGLTQAQEGAPDSLRTDIPKDDVLPENRLSERIKYLELDTPERYEMKPIFDILEETQRTGKK